MVDANCNPVPGLCVSSLARASNVTNFAGFSDAMKMVLHNDFPDYAAQVSITIPIRNRSQLVQRQIEMEVQQLKNAALLDVRNTYIALEQDRARVAAASK